MVLPYVYAGDCMNYTSVLLILSIAAHIYNNLFSFEYCIFAYCNMVLLVINLHVKNLF